MIAEYSILTGRGWINGRRVTRAELVAAFKGDTGPPGQRETGLARHETGSQEVTTTTAIVSQTTGERVTNDGSDTGHVCEDEAYGSWSA